MKKSTIVTLVLSGALMSGCDNRSRYGPAESYADNNDTGTNITNDTYVAGLGYYHAPYHGWFPYRYNYYRPGFGYYHGGIFTPEPFVSDIRSSRPVRPPTFSGGGGVFGAHLGSSSPGSTAHSSSVSRGGFGSIGHGGSIGS